MTDPFALADDLGPEKIIHVTDVPTGLRAILVVDNTACGPAIGGCRMAPDVSLDECFRLARAMTRKNAAAGLPHGGGKSVIFADPRQPAERKEKLIRAFARAIGEVTSYIIGPDMGTDETAMAWCKDEIGRAVGLPPEIGGIPLDELGATGWGVTASVEVAARHIGLELKGARVVVQGFGAVGKHAARFLGELGCVLVAASDSRGTLVNPKGIDVSALMALKEEGKSVIDGVGERAGVDAIIDVDCDIWIPAARPDVLNEANVGRLKTKIVAQGANIPATQGAEAALEKRGVVILPDFIANAGGVICASVEYHGGSQSQAFATIRDKISQNTREVLESARAKGIGTRQAANELAERRIRSAMSYRAGR